jgi:Serine protease inhibitor
MKSVIRQGLFVTLMSSSIILISCEKKDANVRSGDSGNLVNITTEGYQQEIIDSANRFAFDLFKPVLADAKGTENIMISPFSITSAFSMTLNGAAGETFEAMKKTLGLEGKTLVQINKTYLKLMTEMIPVDKSVVLDIANSVWVDKQLNVKQPFITDLQTFYKGEARDIDVTDPDAVNIVNDWIALKTQDKITEMLDKFDPGAAMLLINAVYFNGKWRYKFDKTDTKEEPFYVTPSDPKTVPMMHQIHNFKAIRNNSFTIVDIPYGQGNYTMVVVLPDKNMTNSDVANSLTLSLWQEWMGLLADNSVVLSIPRFKYNYKRLLNKDLIDLGMSIAFTTQADFSNISDQSLLITKILHQSFIDTNEEGTEATAATIVEMGTGAAEPVDMKIDHPFLYFIRESSTGTIIFMGEVNDPTSN